MCLKLSIKCQESRLAYKRNVKTCFSWLYALSRFEGMRNRMLIIPFPEHTAWKYFGIPCHENVYLTAGNAKTKLVCILNIWEQHTKIVTLVTEKDNFHAMPTTWPF